MLKKKIRTPYLDKIKIECHKVAIKQYMKTKDFSYQYPNLRLTEENLQLFQNLNPLHVVQISKNEYQFFSGWFWFGICRQHDCKKITIVIHSDISLKEIEKIAWANLLSDQFKTFHRKNNLSQIVEYLDLMPKHIRHNLFTNVYSISSSIIVENLSHETRGSIRNQIKNSIGSKEINLPSIIDQIGGK